MSKIFKIKSDKRQNLTYMVLIFWVILGIIGGINSVLFTDLTAYFLSLTGFIMSYIFGESVRPSDNTSIYKRGKNSTREILTYIVCFVWMIFGLFGIYFKLSLVEIAAYFAALTPFVGSYIIGETYKKNSETVDNLEVN